MKPVHFCNKGQYMDALEEFEVYKAAKLHKDNLLNDQLLFRSNIVYNTLQRTRRIQKPTDIISELSEH